MHTLLRYLVALILAVTTLGAAINEDVRSRSALAPLRNSKHAKNLIPDRYIVVFKKNADVDAELATLASRITGLNIKHKYKSALKGFSGNFNAVTLRLIRALPVVDYVEQAQKVSLHNSESPADYDLAMVSENGKTAAGNLNTFYWKDGSGSPTVYVIDTGIYTAHPEFGGRAVKAANFISYEGDDDGVGHGTHVAGTIGSNTYGVCKYCTMAAVKVLDSSGSGSNDGVIAGINYVHSVAAGTNSVISMSLGGGFSQAVNDALESAIASGVAAAVAAGNSGDDACYYSPASAPSAITVAANDINYNTPYWTNYGSCVDIFAPGVSITSTWNDGGINTIDGTSMSTPHVSGVMAYFIGQFGSANPGDLASRLSQFADSGFINSPPGASPNVLLNNGYWKY